MSDDERRESIKSGYASMRMIILAIALAGILLDRAYPQKLGRLGGDGVIVGVGILVVVATFLDIRTGTADIYLSKFKRSEDSTGFWTAIAIGIGTGGFMVIGALGDLLGLWRF